ncbi:MAG: glycine cleavage system protein GcvH [Sedimentisphaerales bacterium]|nr:glycine cleavage system protein GcvH [Sedimentisphaerales bacterium]
MIPEELLYTREHEWIRIKDEDAVVGITDHAQKMLGSITFVELGAVGEEVKRQGVVASIESSKAASDVYSPLDGEIVEVNSALEDEPGLVNDDCYGKGWVCKLRLSEPDDIEGLMGAKAYGEYVAKLEEE